MAYNGWANWATWNVALWFGNDESLYREMRSFVRREWRGLTGDAVERFVRDLLPDGTADMDSAKDYSEVDWEEIADNWRDDEADD